MMLSLRCSAHSEKKRIQDRLYYVADPYRSFRKQMTPAGATEILEVLGKEESLARINKAIEKLSNDI